MFMLISLTSPLEAVSIYSAKLFSDRAVCFLAALR